MNQLHTQHLLDSGFSIDQIEQFGRDGLIRSLTAEEATETYFRCDNITGGLEFNFSDTFSQIRLDSPELLYKPGEKPFRYMSVPRSVADDCVYSPTGARAVTEGMKDALAFTYHGGIPTAAVAGVSHITKVLPKRSGHVVIFDADGWDNIRVLCELIKAGLHTGGGIVLVPKIEGEPKAGGCEYFKAGHTSQDYQNLLASALQPLDFINYYIDQRSANILDKNEAIEVAGDIGKLYGEFYGQASARAKEAIKDLMELPAFKCWKIGTKTIFEESGNTKGSLKRPEYIEEEENNPILYNYEFFLATNKCFKSRASEPEAYCEIKRSGKTTTHKIDSKMVRYWIISQYTNNKNGIIGKEQLNGVIARLEGEVINSNEYKSYKVTTKNIFTCGDNHYLALNDDDNTIIKYNGDGWEVNKEDIDTKYIRGSQSIIPMPMRGGDIGKIWDFANVKGNNDRVSVLACLTKVLIPKGMDPVLAFNGQAGSGKSTAADYLTKIFQPSEGSALMSSMPNPEYLELMFKRHRILAVDNLSLINLNTSDKLCAIVGGGKSSSRKLYTDNEVSENQAKGLVILTSIGYTITQADLLERSVRISLDKLGEGQFHGNQDEEFDRYHGQLLGAFLDLAVAALKYKSQLPEDRVPHSRMDELSWIGEAIEQKLKYPTDTFKLALKEASKEAAIITTESSPVASTVVEFINRHKTWTGTSTELLVLLRIEARKSSMDKSLPRTANTLSNELKKCEHSLKGQGIQIIKSRSSNNRLVTITLDNNEATEAPLLVLENEEGF